MTLCAHLAAAAAAAAVYKQVSTEHLFHLPGVQDHTGGLIISMYKIWDVTLKHETTKLDPQQETKRVVAYLITPTYKMPTA